MSYAGSVVAESLTCSICCELLNVPKLLACTHTFCEKCLHTLTSSQGERNQLPCPSCREITHLENGDTSKLQTNVPINSLLEQLKSVRKFCTICDADSKSIALFYCWQCNEFLCESCHHAHGKFKKISSHDMVSVDDVKSGKVRAKHFCGMHPHEELEFVCSTCKEPICFRCRILYHSGSGHQVVEILAFQKTIKSQAKSLQEKSEKKMSAIEDHIGEVEEHLVKVGSVLDEKVAEIHQAYEESLEKLTKRRDELCDELRQQRQMMITELEGIKEVNMKLLAGIKSLCESVAKAAEEFLEGDALVAHNKICIELEEILKIDNPDNTEVKDIGKIAEKLELRRCKGNYIFGRIGEIYQAQGNPLTAPIKADADWYLVKRNTLSIAAAMFSDMAPTPDGKMAVGYELGGIDVFTLDNLQETVLQKVKVNSLVLLSDGRYVVRDMNRCVRLYSCGWETIGDHIRSGRGRMHVDPADNVYFVAYQSNTIVTAFRPRQQSLPNDPENRLFHERLSTLSQNYMTPTTEYYHLNHRSMFIRMECVEEKYYVIFRLEEDPISYKRSFGKRPLRFAVLRDDTILVGWEEDGLVTIERYTYQLRYIKTVLTGYRIDGESFQLSQFSTGEIALCDGKGLHVFCKA